MPRLSNEEFVSEVQRAYLEGYRTAMAYGLPGTRILEQNPTVVNGFWDWLLETKTPAQPPALPMWNGTDN